MFACRLKDAFNLSTSRQEVQWHLCYSAQHSACKHPPHSQPIICAPKLLNQMSVLAAHVAPLVQPLMTIMTYMTFVTYVTKCSIANKDIILSLVLFNDDDLKS